MNRRQFLTYSAFGTALTTTPGLFAEDLVRTAEVGEGPFYPDKLPLDTDNDLLILNDSITPAVGEITHLSGRVSDTGGKPMRNAFVEIWQVDSNASYIHSDSANREKLDGNFQGYGRFLTASSGDYYFRTIKPVEYPGRTPHIHIAVSTNGRRIFTSQILIKGHERNAGDFLFRRVQGPEARETLLAEFKPIEGSKTGELEAQFDIVLGHTAEELDDGTVRGGIGEPVFSGRRRGRGRPRR